ncbi:hypothetical protein [Helicobacter ailurogastricus]|uniref:hypothetical protein n=1 Tax=Helicobacter ailurogastricus TaxID=1578720 RepID=UPI00131582ED|nr:hypothetical protein [Helicobacter ailurogastricus]
MAMREDTQEKLFSTPRLRGYASLAEHEANFALIGCISHKIGILEVVIRNQIDSVLLEKVGDWWQHLPPSIKISGERTNSIQLEIHPSIKIILKITGDISHITPITLVSKQSMGFWLKVVEYFRIYDQIFNPSFLDNLDFKKYYLKNKNRFGTKTHLAHRKNAHLKRHEKADLLLQLLRKLRNRAFHFENLYKCNPKGYPRLNANIADNKHESHHKNQEQQEKPQAEPQDLYVGLHPDKIVLFLDDLLGSFAPELVDYAGGESGGKEST